MARIEGDISIHRPTEAVFDFVADERNEPLYNPHMLTVELISGEPVGMGSRFRTELQTGGRTLPMTVEFTEFDRPRRLASSTHSSMMATSGALTFEPESGGTRMRWSWDVQPRGALRLIPLLVGVVGRRQERVIWGNLKRLLESDEASEPRVMSVLVAYASAHGSTQGVADRIAARLRERGLRVDSRAVDEVGDLDAYDAVVLGSAVYSQRWIPTASTFLRRNADALAHRRVWLFSVGSFGDTHRAIGRLMKKEPRDIDEIKKAIHPRDYRVFAGAIRRDQWPPASRLFFRLFGGHFGDNRDWAGIDSWTATIARSLSAPGP